jgi:hypothetical protein
MVEKGFGAMTQAVPYKTKAKALKQPTAAEIKAVRKLSGLTQ